MDIAALSIGLSQMNLAQEVGISVMKMALETTQDQTADLSKMLEASSKIMEQSVTPHLGGSLDISI